MLDRSLLPRFSIRQLLIWTAFIGFACVSLRSASEAWVAIAFAVVFMALGVTPMLVILRSGADRAYWMGFAVLGSLYLGLLMYSFALEPNAVNSNPLSADNLATARLARYGYDRIHGQNQQLPSYSFTLQTQAANGVLTENNIDFVGIGSTTGTLRATSIRLFGTVAAPSPASPNAKDFVNVAHALWTLLLAACGGRFAQWLYQSRSERHHMN